MPPAAKLSRRKLLAGVAGLAAMLAGCGTTDDSDETPAHIPSSAATDYNRPDLLVDVAWLAQHLNDPAVCLVDCSALPDYRHGHLPNARHVWWQDTIEIHNPVYGMLTGPGGRARLYDTAAMTPESTLVCYDDAGGTYAARFVWMLHAVGWYGARLLDGGRQAWTASGQKLTRETPPDRNGYLTETPNEAVLAHAHDIAARLGQPGIVILDTRTEDERSETWFDALRVGRIPGSQWLPRDAFFQDAGPLLVPPDELRARLQAAGMPASAEEIVVYGLHGTLACLPYIALTALGVPRVRVYDGSWAQWGADAQWPVEAIP